MYSEFSVVQLVENFSTDRAFLAPSGRHGEWKVLNSIGTCTPISQSYSQYTVSLLTALSWLHLDDVEKGKFLILLELVLRSLGRSACSQSLY
jgi:hypothetical protein